MDHNIFEAIEMPVRLDGRHFFRGRVLPGQFNDEGRTAFGRKQDSCSADVIVSDYVPPTPLTDANVNGHLLFGTNGRSVVTTIARGKVLMENRVLLGIDERAVAARARELAVKTWERF